jgi:tetratricopeptide (TPR) repeat protein
MASLFIGCKRSENPATPSQTSSSQDRGGYFKTSFQDESQFVVENIVTDIAEMLYFARNHALPDKPVTVDAREAGGNPDSPVYDLTIQLGNSPAVQTKLNISGPIWSEAVYAEVTSAMAKSLGLQSPSSVPGNDVTMLEHLTDGLAETIAREDLQLSSDLEDDFANPTLHEQAAALLGAFALRENSGVFYDIRLPLCRMTAHLALARFLSGDHPPGIVGRVADCMLLSEMNNQVAAVEQIEHLDTTQKPVAMWARVLRARDTLDFRPLDEAPNASGLEQVARFAAFSASNNRGVAWKKAGEAVQNQPDFCRIAGAQGYSVEMGNVMLQIWLALEIGEIREVYKLMHGQELKKEDLAAALNSDPDRCFVPGAKGAPRVRVVGWGLWAVQLQHHLCLAVTTDFHSLKNKLGLPEDSWNFAKECDEQFGHLRFYDFVRRLDCTNTATYHQSTDDGWAFTVKYPHLTPLAWMDYLCGRVSFAPRYLPIPNPHCNEWTSHNPLPGTAYDVDARLDFPSFTGDGKGDIKKVFKAHDMAPYDLGLCKYIGRWYGTNWTYENANSTFGRLQPYSSLAAACIADSKANEPEQYEKLMATAVKWDPSYYMTLAQYQWERGRTNEAMKSYEQEEQVDPDAVGLANLAPRRVRYYLATGQKEKAKQTADFGAQVYSAGGLESEALYLENTGDLAEAYEWYSKIDERYNDADYLLYFCCRHVGSSGNAGLDKRIGGRLQSWYNERQKVSLNDLSGPPADGVTLTNAGPLLEKLSIKNGDIVVAARGIRVHNMTQLWFARDMDRAPTLKIIYWDGNNYREATATLNAEHLLGATLVNYAGK